MQEVIAKLENPQRKSTIPSVKSGDVVRVHQKVREGGKTRTQVFEGVVIRVRKMNSLQASITVRRIASGVGVEKTFMLHSPLIEQVTIERRSKVRRNYLKYLRERSGKSARMREREFAELAIESDESIEAQVEKSVDEKVKEAKSTEVSSEVEKAEQDHSQEATQAKSQEKQVKEEAEPKKAKPEAKKETSKKDKE